MKTTIFEQAQAQTGLNAPHLEFFLISYVVECAQHACKGISGENFAWDLADGSKIERRLLLNYNPTQSEITVSFEVAYQLFEGDTRFLVKKVGSVKPDGVRSYLPGLVATALQQVNNWKPSCADF
jgi:hypothetical protein